MPAGIQTMRKEFFFHYAFYQVIKTIYLILIFFNLQTIQLINISFHFNPMFHDRALLSFFTIKVFQYIEGKGRFAFEFETN